MTDSKTINPSDLRGDYNLNVDLNGTFKMCKVCEDKKHEYVKKLQQFYGISEYLEKLAIDLRVQQVTSEIIIEKLADHMLEVAPREYWLEVLESKKE